MSTLSHICLAIDPDVCCSLRLFERGECSFRDLFRDVVATFESNIAYTLRFMIDTKVIRSDDIPEVRSSLSAGRRNELDRNSGGSI